MIDGYTETGSSANLTLGRRTVQDIEERFDLTLRQTIALANAHALTAEARLGALAFQRRHGQSEPRRDRNPGRPAGVRHALFFHCRRSTSRCQHSLRMVRFTVV